MGQRIVLSPVMIALIKCNGPFERRKNFSTCVCSLTVILFCYELKRADREKTTEGLIIYHRALEK